jgi:hypothetical protein
VRRLDPPSTGVSTAHECAILRAVQRLNDPIGSIAREAGVRDPLVETPEEIRVLGTRLAEEALAGS